MQVVVGALVVGAGVVLGVAGWLGSRGALPRNRFVGVRTPPAMASDDAFRLANRVAAPPLLAAAAVAVLGGVAVLAAPSVAASVVVLTVVGVGMLALTLAGGVLGSRAAATVLAATVVKAPASPCAGCACGGPGSRTCVR